MEWKTACSNWEKYWFSAWCPPLEQLLLQQSSVKYQCAVPGSSGNGDGICSHHGGFAMRRSGRLSAGKVLYKKIDDPYLCIHDSA